MFTDHAVKASARAMALHLEADEERWEIYLELARLALTAAAPYIAPVDIHSDDYWDSLPTLGAEEA